jgi:hypothetical protein
MSKQSKAKELQGYKDKAPPKSCVACKHFASTTTEETGHYGTWYKESNLRCLIGNFAVKKTAVCNKFEPSK